MTDAKIHNDTTEDEHDGIVHDGRRPDGTHGHNLGTALPADGIVEAVAELVEQSAALHLLEVDGGEHEAEEEEEGFHDDDALGVEDGTLTGHEEDVPPDDHGQTAAEGDARPADGEEPVGEHEEDPVGEVDDGDGPLAKGGELVGHVDVGVVAEDAVAAAGVLQDGVGAGAGGCRRVGAGSAQRSADVAQGRGGIPAALQVGLGIVVHVEDGLGAGLAQFAGGLVPFGQGRNLGTRGSEEGGVDRHDDGDGDHGGTPLPREGRLAGLADLLGVLGGGGGSLNIERAHHALLLLLRKTAVISFFLLPPTNRRKKRHDMCSFESQRSKMCTTKDTRKLLLLANNGFSVDVLRQVSFKRICWN